jgi:hypothetical protein
VAWPRTRQVADGRSGGGEESRVKHDLDQLSLSKVRGLVAQSPFLLVLTRSGLLFFFTHRVVAACANREDLSKDAVDEMFVKAFIMVCRDDFPLSRWF